MLFLNTYKGVKMICGHAHKTGSSKGSFQNFPRAALSFLYDSAPRPEYSSTPWRRGWEEVFPTAKPRIIGKDF